MARGPILASLLFALTDELPLRFVSEGVPALLGFSREAFLHARVRFNDLVHPDDAEIAQTLFSSHSETLSGTFSIRLRHADGRIRCCQGRYTRLQPRKNDRAPLLKLVLRDVRQLREPGDRSLAFNFKSLIEHTRDSVCVKNRNHVILAASRAFANLTESAHDPGEILGKTGYDLFPESIADVSHRLEIHALTEERRTNETLQLPRQDGSLRWIDARNYPVNRPDGSVGGIILFAEDIACQREAEERLRLAASVFTHASEGIVLTDPHGTILEVNDAFTRITGYSRAEAIGQNPRLLKSGLQSREFYESMWGSLLREGHWSGEIWNRTKDGVIYAEMLSINAIRDAAGITAQYVAMFSDITERKEHERQLEHLAHHDALTGLPNRVLLADRLSQAMAHVRRHGEFLAVAFLDLDGFKEVNDRYGHQSGDRLLTAIAARMKEALREGDTLARLGGDEFVAVLLDLPDRTSVNPVLQRLLEAAAEDVSLDGWTIRVSASAGVALYPLQDEADADLLLRQAGQAMYDAKLAGRNRFQYFDPNRDVTVRGRHENLDRIRHALAAGEFVLYYQPIVNMRTNQVMSAEALIRWRHPQRGLLPPGMFLPVIEGHPLSVELGEWVIDSALTQMEAWRAAGFELAVSVNVGAFELQEANFVDRLRTMLLAHPEAKPGRLDIEVLETSALEDIVQTSSVMEACREMGVSFALDDFGSGYSSLTYLQRLPVNVLKIDQSFVRDMIEEPENLAILEAVLGLAGAFRRRVVAEGVETADHGLMLLQLGCELAQGYGIARPMPASELPRWAARWRSDPRWVASPPVSPRNRSLLFACVEHRAWLAALESYLKGKRRNPPSLDPGECRFGAWLETEIIAGRSDLPAFQAIQVLHGQLHSLAADILATQRGALSEPSLERLPDLHGLRDELFEHLAVFN
jgi:diguanylate cyclase (GGDEF)-like protein/PAS domain S-box-containing protein